MGREALGEEAGNGEEGEKEGVGDKRIKEVGKGIKGWEIAEGREINRRTMYLYISHLYL